MNKLLTLLKIISPLLSIWLFSYIFGVYTITMCDWIWFPLAITSVFVTILLFAICFITLSNIFTDHSS